MMILLELWAPALHDFGGFTVLQRSTWSGISRFLCIRKLFFFLSLFPYPVSDIIIYARGFTIFNSFFLIFRGNRRFIVC